jgi:putative transposase
MRFQFRVLAYCLMSNHVHIALERGPIALSRIMLALQSFYVQRFNRRHRRVGHLFQGRYKSLLVQDERYLLALVRYIHMNPVAAGVVSRPDAFGWSSDLHYRAGVGPAWLDVGRLLDSFSRRRREAVAVYRRLMAERDSQTYEDVPDFLRAIKGEQKFANWALHAAGDSRRVSSGSTPEQIAHAIAAAENLSVERLRAPGKGFRESRARLIAAYLGKRDYGQSTAAMARCLAREESTFNRGVRRLEETMAKDPAVRARVEELAASLRHRNTGIHD